MIAITNIQYGGHRHDCCKQPERLLLRVESMTQLLIAL